MATLSKVQIEKARAKIAEKLMSAAKAFREANSDYKDIVLDKDELRAIADLTKALSEAEFAAKVAELRLSFVREERSTETLDLLTVKTEKNIGEEDKFVMSAWLPVKRYKLDGSIWKAGFGSPELSYTRKDSNSFILVAGDTKEPKGSTFQVLRSKGLFQLMSDAEIDAAMAEYPISFDLYFQLFL